MRDLWVAAITSGVIVSASHAGSVTEVSIAGQPLQYAEEGAIDGCGIRLVGAPAPVQGVKTVPVLDVSFNVIKPGGGLVKGGLKNVSAQGIRAGDLTQMVDVPIASVWLKAPGKSATKPGTGKPLASLSHKHALMYVTTVEEVLTLVAAVREGRPIQIGFRVIKEDMDRIFFGTVRMSEAEQAQFWQCFDELSEAFQRQMDASPKK